MALWFDMTWSLVEWKGGVTGIVRAELELARQVKRIDPAVRICIYEGGQIRQIPSGELEWLWNAGSVTDAYLAHFNRKKREVSDAEDGIDIPDILRIARDNPAGRIVKITDANKILISNTKPPLKYPVALGLKAIEIPLRIASKVRLDYLRGRKVTRTERRSFIYTDNSIFSEGDTLFTCGWLMDERDEAYGIVRERTDDFKLVYFVYDLILVNDETKHLYQEEARYGGYLSWLSRHCDKVIYGGNTALEDTRKYFQKNNLHFPAADHIKFGSDIIPGKKSVSFGALQKKYSISDDFVMMVGTIDAKKNQDVLYRAYHILADEYRTEEYPQLVLVASVKNGAFLDRIICDPKIKGRIIVISPSDDELDRLYRKAKFVLLTSLYEGWSLTLPEGLNYGKMCLVSDVAPLREIGEGLCEFIHPYDAGKWAEKIVEYYCNPDKLKECEERIKKEWHTVTWEEAGEDLYKKISNVQRIKEVNRPIAYDMTLAFWAAYTDSGVSGITRVQLMLARKLYAVTKNMYFFSLYGDRFLRVEENDIEPILDERYSVDEALDMCKEHLIELNDLVGADSVLEGSEGDNRYAAALLLSVLPTRIQNRLLRMRRRRKTGKNRINAASNAEELRFEYNSLVFSAGAGYSDRIYAALGYAKKERALMFCQVIYDYSAIKAPHTHLSDTVISQKQFLKSTHELADTIFYGGESAKEDGIRYAKENGLQDVEARVIRFGSDFNPQENLLDKKEVFSEIGINKDYILVVGTIQLRKNYDTLYLAYAQWVQEDEDVPQLIFAGYPGWKTEELLSMIERDTRVAGKLIICSPSDEELDVLYENSLYCILASQYEGWSLTLPQALNYGKFVLCSDVEPIREIGKDLVDYVPVFDTFAWKDKMKYYAGNEDVLQKKEADIRKNWHNITWDECAEDLYKDLVEIAAKQ